METAHARASRLAQDLIAVGDFATRKEAADLCRNVAAAAAEPACYMVEYNDRRVPIMGKEAAEKMAELTGGTVKPLGVIAGHC
ncbi:hypothetical protein AB4076_11055 [Dyella sp. 2RAF44]|uniref:hypothetical protein n=1 Tax=Dyella sp. 2RAF44 TaxID=3233000 RepID=UPI003F93347E